jgi:hypothetical protein
MKSKKLLPLLLALSAAWCSQIVSAQSVVFDDSDGPFSILAQMVTVLSPNGGENWNGGEAHDITWSLDVSITNVNIDYSIDSGNNWTPVASNIANSGTYAWTVPATPSLNCLVRVSAAGNAGNNDFSDRVFAISSASTETITAPSQPVGPAAGVTGNIYSFSSGGSNSNFGDALQYKFDWGDGTDSGWLAVGTVNAEHAWATVGNYEVKVIARCATHTGVESPWSETHGIAISKSIQGLLWSTFLGGNVLDTGVGIYSDSSGNLYICGKSESTWGSPINPYGGGESDAFVAKLSADGNLLWNTFLGGSSADNAYSIALDASGNILVAGYSNASWGSPLNSFAGGGADAFVAKLNSNGVYQWHTFLGGNNYDCAWCLTVDDSNNIYVSGRSDSSWGSPLNSFVSKSDAFIAKLNVNGIRIWNTFLGGSESDIVLDISLDDIFNIYVTGTSFSTWGNPINPFYGTSDFGEAFVAKMNNNGLLQWNTFMGGSSHDNGSSITIDSNDNILISGTSRSTWGTPINPFSGGFGYAEAFVAKLNSNGTRMWNTFMGGVGEDYGSAFSLDSAGNIYISGYSTSSWGSPLNLFSGGSSDAFVSKLNSDGSLAWNTFLGGSEGYDFGGGILIDNNGNIVITGYSGSSWGCPILSYAGGAYDAFVAKLSAENISISVITPNGGEIWEAGQSHSINWSTAGGVVSKVNIDYSINGGNSWNSVTSNLSNSGSYSWTVPATPSTNCLVRVSDATDGIPTDSSNAAFTISAAAIYVTVTSPNGGEQWQQGTVHDITWTSAGVDNIKIELMKGTKRNATLSSSYPASGGSFLWLIPSSQTISSDYKIRITSTSNSSLVDSSDASFAIFAPSITVTAPATGATWQRGVTHTITWTWEGIMNASVKILLYKGTKLNSTISTDTPNDGSFDWTIPANQVLATTYKIRIVTLDGLVTADSGTFSITASGGLTLLSPNDGEKLPTNQIFPIRWTVDPSVQEVKLEYSRDNGGSFTLIADNIPNVGYYEWQVPVNFTHNGIIRVSDSYGKNWLNEYGVLETSFKFSSNGLGVTTQPDIVVWYGSSDVNSPGYGFARVSLGRESIQMAEVSQTIEPLNNGWHEVKIRLDLKRDLGALFIDGKPMLENVSLYTSKNRHFEPYLSIRSGGGSATELMLAGLRVQVTLLSADGNETDHFTIMNEDFGNYEDPSNAISNCWQVMGLKLGEPGLVLKTLPGSGRVLRLRNVTDSTLTISKPLSIPDTIPFDISDRSFIIEMRQGED